MQGEKMIGILLSGAIFLSGSAMVFGADTVESNKTVNISIKENVSNTISKAADKEEPLARLQVITDEEEISKITSENPEIKNIWSKMSRLLNLRLSQIKVKLKKSGQRTLM